jgi:hypothetical protein
VLSLGFVFGGFLSALLDWMLPESPAKQFFTWTVSPSVGPFEMDLLLFSATVGPIALRVSLLGIVGIVLAYMLARSLF